MTNKVVTLRTAQADVLLADKAAQEFEDALVELTAKALDSGAFTSTVVGILNTTAFQIMFATIEAEDAGE